MSRPPPPWAVLVERFAVPKARLVALAAEIGMDAVGDYLRGLIDRADELRAEASVAAYHAVSDRACR